MPTLKRCHVAWVDACMYDMPLKKSWAFASTAEDIRLIASLCSHAHKHQSIRGTKDATQSFLFSSPSLSPCTQTHQRSRNLCLEPPCVMAQAVAAADQTLPMPSSPLKDLSLAPKLGPKSLHRRASYSKSRIALCLAQEEALSIIINTLGLNNADSLVPVCRGQPLRLVPMLKAGVSTEVQEPIPSSFQWPKSFSPIKTMPLEMCDARSSLTELQPFRAAPHCL